MLKMRRSRRNDGDGELRKILGDAEIPMIPALVAAAIDSVSAPDCDLRDVAEIVGRDPGLSARLLSVVNSAAYAPRNPILGVTQAVTMFGRNHLESMLICLAASATTKGIATPGLNMARFWTTAAWRASAAGLLSRLVDRSRSSENFSAALLEDIAVPILSAARPGYQGVLEAWEMGKGQLVDLEQRAFGWTHKTVGGWLFEEWGFPDALRTAATEVGPPDHPDVQYPVVRLVSALGSPRDRREVISEVAEQMEEIFDLPRDTAADLLETARSDAAVLAQSLS